MSMHPVRMMSMGNMSGIAPDESQAFLTSNDHQSLFGTGNIGPDRIRLSMANMNAAASVQSHGAGMLAQ